MKDLNKLTENTQKLIYLYKKTLYIVPTPIGNLQDITYRALETLRQVDYIISKDTRRTNILLNYFSIRSSLCVMNRYNEVVKVPILIERLQKGCNMALVSDSGTLLINDPGYHLIRSCHDRKIRVIPLPGPCAAITALCGSGLPANRFCFDGFLPSKRNLRLNRFKMLSEDSRTLIFYDVKHRVIDSLKDMVQIFGSKRYVVLVRELTKIWESIHGAPVGQLLSWIQEGIIQIQREIVLVVSGDYSKNRELSSKVLYAMRLLTTELSLRKAAILVSKMYKVKKNILYQRLLNEKIK